MNENEEHCRCKKTKGSWERTRHTEENISTTNKTKNLDKMYMRTYSGIDGMVDSSR